LVGIGKFILTWYSHLIGARTFRIIGTAVARVAWEKRQQHVLIGLQNQIWIFY